MVPVPPEVVVPPEATVDVPSSDDIVTGVCPNLRRGVECGDWESPLNDDCRLEPRLETESVDNGRETLRTLLAETP